MDDEDNKAHFNLDDLLIDKKKSGKNKSKKSQGGEENKKADDDFKVEFNMICKIFENMEIIIFDGWNKVEHK